ncbi:MAG: hypothetical protein U0835_13655 [Isosphaeraceae bacterium]
MSGGEVTVFDILGMRLRNNPPKLLIDAYLSLKTQGVDVSIGDVERAYIVHKARVQDSGDLVEAVRQDRR